MLMMQQAVIDVCVAAAAALSAAGSEVVWHFGLGHLEVRKSIDSFVEISRSGEPHINNYSSRHIEEAISKYFEFLPAKLTSRFFPPNLSTYLSHHHILFSFMYGTIYVPIERE